MKNRSFALKAVIILTIAAASAYFVGCGPVSGPAENAAPSPETGPVSSPIPLPTSVPVPSPTGPVLFVNGAFTGTSDGTASNPFKRVQDAVNAADSGDQVHVAQGTYAENIDLPANASIAILGGYQDGDFGFRDPETYPTRLLGDGTAPVVSLDFSGGSSSNPLVMIDGFIISGGTKGIACDSLGNGGMPELIISNNVIEGNGIMLTGEELLPLWGGGIVCDGMAALIVNNRIRDNASGKGSGMAVHLYDQLDEIRIEGNVIQDNVGHADHGGGVYLSFLRGAFMNNIVSGNRIGETAGYGWGGGIIVDGGQRTGFSDSVYVTLSGNVFTGNHAPTIGGAVFIDEGANVRMLRELIYGNTISDAGNRGGAGIYVDGARSVAASRTVLQYCTVADNAGVATSRGNAIYAEVADDGLPDLDVVVEADRCIFWNNHSGDQLDQSDFYVEEDATGRHASITMTNTTYQHGCSGDGSFTATDCSNADPGFADPGNGDYASALVDRGAFAD